MPGHQYTAKQALEILLKKIRQRREDLAAEVQAAIDAGKDVSETEPSPDRRKKDRVYRKTVPFTHQEALQIAIDALQSHLVEQPLFVESARINFSRTGVGETIRRIHRPGFDYPRLNVSKERQDVSVCHVDEEKTIEIELQSETQIEKSGPQTQTLEKLDHAQIEERQRQLSDLRRLVDFQPE